jgi:hypothetical protein
LAKVVSRRASGNDAKKLLPATITDERLVEAVKVVEVASPSPLGTMEIKLECSHRGQSGFGRVARRAGVFARMIGLLAGTRIWIAAGVTDLRRGFTGLSGMVQTTLQENPFSGHVFVFRGRPGDLIKMLWWDGDGLCLFANQQPQS